MKKRIVKKSEVLKEGYLNGLRRAKRIITEMLAQQDASDDYGLNVDLIRAIQNNNLQEVKMIYRQDPSLINKANDENEATPLITALNEHEPNPSIVKFLLDNGADPNIPDADGLYPLHYAACGKYDCCRLLLQYDADLSVTNHRGETPYEYALKFKNYYPSSSETQYKIMSLLMID